MPNEYRIGKLKGRFVVSWWEDGKRKRYRLDARTAAEAESEAVTVIKRELAQPDSATVKELWEAYRKEKEGRRVAAAMAFEWKALEPHFGSLHPRAVTIDHCRAYTAARRKAGKHDGTIWTELGHLRSVLRWAYGEQAQRIERPAKPAPKGRWLNRGEITKLLETPKAPHIDLAIQLMLATACRVGAALELTWDRVDFDHGHINLRTTDTGPRKGRAVVPMNAGLRAALSTAKAAAISDYVIEWAGGPVKSIKTGFNKAVRDAGLADVTPHTLRHTSAVHLAAAGISMNRIAQYLGHSNSAVTERVYARFAPEHMKEESAILDFTVAVRKVQ